MWFSGNPPSERCIFFNKQGSCFYQILPEFRHRPHSLPIAPVAPFEPEKAINVFCSGNSPGVPKGGFCRRLTPFFIFIKCLAHDKKPGVDLLSCSGHQAVHIPLKPLLSGDIAACPKRVVDRKSTRLNSSHVAISYAVFCL